MPTRLALYDGDDVPAGDITIAISGGEESAIFVRRIWNDKDSDFEDTSTAAGAILFALANIGAGFVRYGNAPLDERWFRARVTGALGTMLAYVTGTQAIGTNSDLMIGDIPPQGGVEIELQAIAPGGGAAAATFKFEVDDGGTSSPLGKFATLATGSGVLPADRVDGLLAIVSGGEVTADDTDTVAIARGKMVAGGVTVAFPATSSTFTLADSAAVDLGAGDDYLVTLSRTADGVLVVTKGLEADATHPAVPAGNVLETHLTVASADGIAVTVAQSSVVEGPRYGAFAVRAGTGLAVIVARGEGVSTDMRQRTSGEVIVPVVASETNRVWRLGNGADSVTQTDAPPEIGADLMALAITDAGAVTSVVDMRRFAHRALVTFPIELVWRGVLTGVAEPSHGLALAFAYDDLEIEAVELNVTGLDAGLTADALKIDVLTVAPGVAVPFPAGGAGGTTIFTSATDDARPSIAFDATVLRVITEDHEVRRFPRGTRFLLSAITTVTGPGAEPEQEIRVTLHARRYR